MGTGIIICGLNGAGKSTLGKALSAKMGFHFIDSEDLYFPKTDSHNLYAASRTRAEVEALLFSEIKSHENFILASVKGDYGEAVYPFFQHAILIDVPKDVGLKRVESRSFQKFGSRMLPGGDLYEQEKDFLDFVSSRDENTVEEWVQRLTCPIIRIDGTKSIEENIKLLTELI